MMRWSYCILAADGDMDIDYHTGPMPPKRLKELLGGEPSFVPFRDGVVAAVRKDMDSLPANTHFLNQGGHLKGTVVLGKYLGKDWVGVLGVDDGL